MIADAGRPPAVVSGAVIVVSAKGRARAHADIPQGAAKVPREVVPEIPDGVHGAYKVPQPYDASLARFGRDGGVNNF
jgi:hypothetical protein